MQCANCGVPIIPEQITYLLIDKGEFWGWRGNTCEFCEPVDEPHGSLTDNYYVFVPKREEEI